MHSAFGKECIQFEGKLIENPEARTTIRMQLKKHQLTLDDGSCASADFTEKDKKWSKEKGGVKITIWNQNGMTQLIEQLTFV